jgi:hypothetical protein
MHQTGENIGFMACDVELVMLTERPLLKKRRATT